MKPIITGCVTRVQTILMTLARAYYSLTINLPRRLPRTHDEYNKLKGILHRYYGLEDDPQVWSIVANQVQSPSPTNIRIPYKNIINPVKRFYTNAIAQDHKMVAYKEINERLKAITLKAAEDFEREEKQSKWSDIVPGEPGGVPSHVQVEASHIQGELPRMPVITERMV